MDFGGLDFGLENNNSVYDLDPNTKWFGSGGGGGGVLFKQEKPVSVSVSASATTAAHNEDEWRDLKMAKTSQDDFSKATLLQQQQQRSNSSSVYYDSQNMLSFSTPTMPYCARSTTGYGMRGVIGGVRGPFTPSQWMELEHQALIYKYITLNAPIPSNLLIPIRKALETAAYHPNPRHTAACYGWGGFQLGFSNSSDPEPGRCRRTDGKKWRCSRDAVADQKYCERHMNRGRHRSRKPVEGQTGHSVSNGPTAATATAAPKVSPSAAVLTTHLHHHTTSNPAPSYSHDDRNFLYKGVTMGSDKIQDATPLSILSASSIGLKQTPLSSVSVLPQSEFGLVCSDSLLNPLHKNGNGGQKSQNSLRQFMEDRTLLSISIPMGSASSSDLMSSSTSSPISERLNLSPLRMGLGVGNTINTNANVLSERSSWIPVSWETSMGGPLGEVLHHSTNNSPSALNLMTDGWESGQHSTLSPTGVLQKTAFGSLSNSSAGSSPRAADNNHLGSTLISSSLPLL